MVSAPGVVEIIDVPAPEISPSQALVRVLRYSPYGTDIELASAHDERYRRQYPIGIGVDFSGVIERVGDGVEGWHVGDRVTSAGLPSCGACPECRAGRRNLCLRHAEVALPRQEVAQEYAAVEANMLTRLPSGVSLDQAAMLSGVMTAVHGLDLAAASSGEECVVFGLGAMGQAAVAVARAYGCRVIGVGVGKENQRLAGVLGCDHIVDVPDHDAPVSDLVRECAPGGVRLVVETTCRDWGLREAFAAAAPGGRVVLLGGGALPASGWDLIERELSVIGVRAAPDKDKALDLVARGSVDLTPTVTRRVGMEDLPHIFAEWIHRNPTRARGRVMVDVGHLD